MLLHEWLQYRDRRIRKLHSQVDEEEKQAEEAEAQEEAEAEGPAEANGEPVEVAPVDHHRVGQERCAAAAADRRRAAQRQRDAVGGDRPQLGRAGHVRNSSGRRGRR